MENMTARHLPNTGTSADRERRAESTAVKPAVVCVALDGVLVRTDTWYECIVATLCDSARLIRLAASLSSGPEGVSACLGACDAVDVALLPYETSLIDLLRSERARGRRIILIAGRNGELARAIADHLGLFDAVIVPEPDRASRADGSLAAIRAHLGDAPFAYVGRSADDMPVWRAAASRIVVNATPAVLRDVAALGNLEASIDAGTVRLRAAFRAMRPHQWVKNLLVFVPILAASDLLSAGAWLAGMTLFLGLSFTASSIYLLNDLCDLRADRQHRSKRRRPFASGALPLQAGLVMVPGLLATGLLLGYLVEVLPLLAAYAVLSAVYSFRLKAMPLVDLFVLAALYTLRIVAGGEATDHPASLWLLAFSGFFFFSLAVVKRVAELLPVAEQLDHQLSGRGYRSGDLLILQLMGVCASFMSSVVLALFVQSDTVAARYASPGLLWVIVPLILFWQCRVWLATMRGQMDEDPIVYATRDKAAWISGAGVVSAMLAAQVSP